MRKQFLIPVMVGMLAFSAAQAFAQSATVVMRNGDRVRADVIDMGADFTFNVNGQERRVPLGDVVLIDFAGDGRNSPVEEINKANAANGGFIVMRNGEQVNTRLQDFMGKPLVALFADGRKSNLGDISRIYFGSVGNVPGFPTTANSQTITDAQTQADRMARRQERREARAAAPANAREVVVPSNVQWTNSGISVSSGQRLRFETTGDARLSVQNVDDVAQAGGTPSGRRADNAPVPSAPAGALIGRIGNGQPFVIGNTNLALDMPASGRLFLGVNDDAVVDNSGNFVVRIWEP